MPFADITKAGNDCTMVHYFFGKHIDWSDPDAIVFVECLVDNKFFEGL